MSTKIEITNEFGKYSVEKFMGSRSEQDEEWLYANAARIGWKPTESEVEAFTERVAIKIQCGGVEEGKARMEALEWISWSRRNKQEVTAHGSSGA
jgi:hypothetical protein